MANYVSKCGEYTDCDTCVRRESDFCFWCHLAECYLAPAPKENEL